jgi:hypothetical protein
LHLSFLLCTQSNFPLACSTKQGPGRHSRTTSQTKQPCTNRAWNY